VVQGRADMEATGEGIVFSDIRKNFPGRDGGQVVIGGVTLEVARGRLGVLLGPSGCGKSTLLRMVAGLVAPTSGEVRVLGMDPGKAVSEHKIGMAFQDSALFPWRTVRRNIALPLEIARPSGSAGAVDELLKLVGLQNWGSANPSILSGGMRERVSLARALVSKPAVLLLDEPFRSLDELTRFRLNQELQLLWGRARPTVLMVTHSVDDALVLADDLFLLTDPPTTVRRIWRIRGDRPRGGEFIRSGAYAELRAEVLAEILNLGDSEGGRLTSQTVGVM